jgi:hypothetical protein
LLKSRGHFDECKRNQCLSPGKGSGQQLQRFFSRVASALKPGGLFLFDVILKEGEPMNYRKWWEGKDWAVLVEFKEDKLVRALIRNIVTFRKLGATWRRGQEEHRIRLFTRAEILKGLRKVGFSVRIAGAYAGFRLPQRRLAFIAHITGRRKDRNR